MTMNTNLLKWSLLLSVVVALCLSAASYAQLTTYQQQEWLHSRAASSHIGNLTGAAPAAAMPYRRYCVGCHGPLGDGNGENMQWINPKPRDFQLAIFKCRSTPTGTLPTDQEMYDSIRRGLDRSNMPSWNALTKQERADLVAWIKHFSPRWQNEKAGTPIQIPPAPEITPDRVKTGQEVFRKMECWKCHGVEGMANGPSSSTLTDDLGRPISPFNFTDGSRPLCGNITDPTDIVPRLDWLGGFQGEDQQRHRGSQRASRIPRCTTSTGGDREGKGRRKKAGGRNQRRDQGPRRRPHQARGTAHRAIEGTGHEVSRL